MSKQFWIGYFALADAELQSRFLDLNVSSCKSAIEDLGLFSSNGVPYESVENRVF